MLVDFFRELLVCGSGFCVGGRSFVSLDHDCSLQILTMLFVTCFCIRVRVRWVAVEKSDHLF
jgi:hypothetical protein